MAIKKTTKTSIALDTLNIEAQKAELEAQIAELSARLEAKRLPDNEELAIALHQKLCHLDHIEACGWDYEGDDWSRYAHKFYYAKANGILSETTFDAAIAVLHYL